MADDSDEDQMFNPQQAAEYLGMDMNVLNTLTVDDEIPSWFTPGDPEHDGPSEGLWKAIRQYRYSRYDLDEWRQEQEE